MAEKKPTSQDRELTYREAFLAELSRIVAAPSSEWPTTHCWTETSLKKLFHTIRDNLSTRGLGAASSAPALIDWLGHLGLAQKVSAEGETFYVLDLGGSAEAPVDPYELLMAAKPAGVICYFSAVAYHSLTTQPVAHHHIAELRSTAPSAKKRSEGREADQEASPDPAPMPSKPPKLGELLFRYQGTPFYSTSRSARLVPGVQLRGYGPRSQIRITTLEQTLLDLLYKPFHGGGPEVVFEAWREGQASGPVDEERMADYLTRMSYPATTRRVGAMLEILGQRPGRELQRVLTSGQGAIDRNAPYARISLLPGVNYSNLDEDWLVSVP